MPIQIDEILKHSNASHAGKATMHGCAAILLYGFGALVAFGLLVMGSGQFRLRVPVGQLVYAALGISLLFLVIGWARERIGAHRTPCGTGDTSNPLFTPLHGSPPDNPPGGRMRSLASMGLPTLPMEHPDSPDRLLVRLLFGCWHEVSKAIQARRRRVVLSGAQRMEAQRILDWLVAQGTGQVRHDISGCGFDTEVLEKLVRAGILRFRLEGEVPCLSLSAAYADGLGGAP